MADNYLQHQIAAIRHQMKALDEALGMLESMLAQTVKETKETTDAMQCPKCGSGILSPLALMGQQKQYFCSECDFKGAL